MAGIRSERNRTTEMRLAALLRTHELHGWRRKQRLPGRPDFVFRRQRVALFVDGCFWHGCRLHAREPRQNASYWASKRARNRQRDREVRKQLVHAGWRVVRIWEHTLCNERRVLTMIRRALNGLHTTR